MARPVKKLFTGTQNFTFPDSILPWLWQTILVLNKVLSKVCFALWLTFVNIEHDKINILTRKLCTEYCFTLKNQKLSENSM